MVSKLIAPLRVPSQQPPYAAQTVVEFALVSLVLFALVFGIIDFGRAIMTRGMLTNAVREATRTGILDPNNTTAILTAAQNRSPTLDLGVSNLTVTCSHWGTNGVAGATVSCNRASSSDKLVGYRLQVCIRHTFTILTTGVVGVGSISMEECGLGLIQ